MEEAKKMKCYIRLIYKQFSKSRVLVAHSFWVICRNVSGTFVELCLGKPYWCTVLVHQYIIWPPEININIWSSLFLQKLFLSTWELAFVRINTSSNTWNGYTAENQEERFFFNEAAFLFWCHARWKLGSSNCSIFEMKHATGLETCTKIYFLFIFNLRETSLFWLYKLMTSL